MSKFYTSGVVSVGRKSHEATENGSVLEYNKSGFSMSSAVRKNDAFGELKMGAVAERKLYLSSYKKGTKTVQKYSNTESVPCSDNT